MSRDSLSGSTVVVDGFLPLTRSDSMMEDSRQLTELTVEILEAKRQSQKWLQDHKSEQQNIFAPANNGGPAAAADATVSATTSVKINDTALAQPTETTSANALVGDLSVSWQQSSVSSAATSPNVPPSSAAGVSTTTTSTDGFAAEQENGLPQADTMPSFDDFARLVSPK
jgi:hypothetical protein